MNKDWKKEKSEIGGIICQCGNPIIIDRINNYWISKLSQQQESIEKEMSEIIDKELKSQHLNIRYHNVLVALKCKITYDKNNNR